jgi:hypothetical protein
MTILRRLLDALPYSVLFLICLTWGLAPFLPEPHIWEKLKMLAVGALVKPLDIFDLTLHGLPWLALIAKLILTRHRA